MEDMTTLTLRKSTNIELGELGNANESKGDIIEKLIDFYKKKSPK